jgi:hypothetical protein
MPPETSPLTPELEARARQSILGGAGVMPGRYALAVFAALDACREQLRQTFSASSMEAVLAELDACRAERDRLALALDQARGVLRGVEWGRKTGPYFTCPACHKWQKRGHRPDCPLARALSGGT